MGIEPGDEVIVTPWTMSAAATAILHWNAIPVFADIEADHYCIDPVSVDANISPRTRAILAVDIFGHPANMPALKAIADKYGLLVSPIQLRLPVLFVTGGSPVLSPILAATV